MPYRAQCLSYLQRLSQIVDSTVNSTQPETMNLRYQSLISINSAHMFLASSCFTRGIMNPLFVNPRPDPGFDYIKKGGEMYALKMKFFSSSFSQEKPGMHFTEKN